MPDPRKIFFSIPRPLVGIIVFLAVALGSVGIVILGTATAFFENPVETVRDISGKMLTPHEAELKKMKEEWEATIADFKDETEKMPPFVFAPHNVVPEDRLLTYFRVQNNTYKFVAGEFKKRPKLAADFTASIKRIQFFSEWVPRALAYNMAVQKMRSEEHTWITEEMYKVALWAMNWYWDNREQYDRLRLMRETLAGGIGLLGQPDPNTYDRVAHPEWLDASQIPLQNRQYLFKYKSDFRWQLANFDGLDLTGLDLMDPPPAVGPKNTSELKKSKEAPNTAP